MAREGVRSPTSHRTPKQIRDSYKDYHSKPKQKKNRAARNAARATLGLKKGDNRDAGHKRPLSKGGSNAKSNLKAQSRRTNRGHGMS